MTPIERQAREAISFPNGDRQSFAAQPGTVKVALLASGNDDVVINAEITDLTGGVIALRPRKNSGSWSRVLRLLEDHPAWARSSSERSEKPHPCTASQPEEIAEVIAFLVSPRASSITGTSVAADGGRRAT